ncbi:unnamed protein product [Mortierella alpina]
MEPAPAPSLEVLQANSHLVQDLYLALFSTRNSFLQHTVAALQNLKKLSFRAMYMREATDEVDWLSLRPLLINNHGIEELSIANIRDPACFAHIAEHCTARLTTLQLSNLTLDWSQLLPVLTHCRRLSKLECQTCSFHGSEHWRNELITASKPVTSNITNLQLYSSSGESQLSLVDWMKLCPRLETLSITKDRTIHLGSDLQLSPGPQLSSITLDCRHFKDAELAEVLARCTNLEQLTLEKASIARNAFGALSGHFGSLVCLNLLKRPMMIGQWIVRRIFEGCSRLVELYLHHVNANSLYNAALDSQEDTPWACRESLKKLWIATMTTKSDNSSDERFMKQLRNLKQLQDLSFNAIFRGTQPKHFLESHENTPETLLLASMCKWKAYKRPDKDLEDPTWRLLREAWPRLLHFGHETGYEDPDSE